MIADTPPPPYTAVIFTSVQKSPNPDGYAQAARDMEQLAARQPGYLGFESARDSLGIGVSYWATAEDALRWKQVVEHRAVQRIGAEHWYADYRVRIATVERDYGLQK